MLDDTMNTVFLPYLQNLLRDENLVEDQFIPDFKRSLSEFRKADEDLAIEWGLQKMRMESRLKSSFILAFTEYFPAWLTPQSLLRQRSPLIQPPRYQLGLEERSTRNHISRIYPFKDQVGKALLARESNSFLLNSRGTRACLDLPARPTELLKTQRGIQFLDSILSLLSGVTPDDGPLPMKDWNDLRKFVKQEGRDWILKILNTHFVSTRKIDSYQVQESTERLRLIYQVRPRFHFLMDFNREGPHRFYLILRTMQNQLMARQGMLPSDFLFKRDFDRMETRLEQLDRLLDIYGEDMEKKSGERLTIHFEGS